ncbi:MAG: thiamine ABC transporter substrate-binding protein [Treponema sp.]|nr:thiamine ABC transporter substrate-binding protein [Treponema sp.]
MKFNKFISPAIFVLLCSFAVISCKSKKEVSEESSKSVSPKRLKEIVVYTYDSFAGEWGPGPELINKFESKTGYKLTLVDCGDSIQAFNRAVLEKDSPQADVIIGIDNNLAPKARSAGILEEYEPKDSSLIIDKNLREALGNDNLLTPYDYSHFAMIYDTQSSVPEPKSLEDLASDVYKKKIILMDSRTSTPGLGFLAWTVSVFGDGYLDYWKQLKPNILSMTSGWSEGWGMFMNGEAPLVISYTTSPAYNVEYEDNSRFIALVFDEGHVQQVEGYGLLKGAQNPKGAKAFMDYLITEEAQNILPLTQWMYPVNKNVTLPESYKKAAPIPSKTLKTDSAATEKAVSEIQSLMAQ